jgi:NAD(P)-dependent dehydrogenase (short-subunit alcohol dehydrogenase family)
MRAQRSGTIVNVSSIVASSHGPFGGLYSSSKAAVNGISEALYYELAPFGVRVVLVEPGAYPTTCFLSNAQPGRNATPASPYAELRHSMQEARSRALASERTDPQEVADAIYRAVYTDMPRFRYVVGGLAELIAKTRQSTDFEGYERFMRTRLNWHAGERLETKASAAS